LSRRWTFHVAAFAIRTWDFAVHASVVLAIHSAIVLPVHTAIVAILTAAIFGTILSRTIHWSTFTCRNNVAPMKIRWLRSGCDRRASMIVGGP
jgi:TRAP-type C4-dicarboxylate transport system permease large subunit